MSEIVIEVISEKIGSKEHNEIMNMIREIIEECKFKNVRIFEREVFDENITVPHLRSV